ncbi:MAG: glycosyltransferase family 1 protein [Ruminococcaceae bacterium]|nr:glycosyltransferase family 1 protein [Oscillospiraceae bacterium]
MIRVLQCVNNMHRAGLETMLMNYYRSIDKTCVQFDFLTHRPFRSDYDDEIESLGGKIYYAPRLMPQNYRAYFAYMKEFFSEHPEYRIVHSHIDSMSYLPLLAAKKAGVPVRIAHSHSTGIDLDLKYPLKQYFRHQLTKVTTHNFACGEKAGEFLFRGKEFTVIPNAVDSASFYYDETVRTCKREELGIFDKLVIGHVGRMTYPKNHEFLLRLFAEILKLRSNAVLLLIGTGEKEDKLKKMTAELGIEKSVMFLGNRGDVNELYQAMDIFVLPSHFEGIPLVGVEAQFAGLPCLFSDGVPKELCFSDTCRFRSLSEPMSVWVDDVFELTLKPNRNATIASSPYDIKNAAGELQMRYEELATVGEYI